MVRYAEAIELQKEELLLSQKKLGLSHPVTADSMRSLADLYTTIGRIDLAEKLLVEALDVYVATLGEESILTADCLNDLGLFYQNHGSPDKATELYQRALEGTSKNHAMAWPDLK